MSGNQLNIIGIIPARMASSRFPGKPLAKIHGIAMVGHVYFRSKMCRVLNDLYVATCDKEIADYIQSIRGKTMMTAATHERASDRTAEAMLKIEQETGKNIDIVVMIQGDEPMLYPQMIEQAIKPVLEDTAIQVVNLMSALKSTQEQDDPNTVKVVVDLNNHALYFSREAIPSRKNIKGQIGNMYKQVPIIPFRSNFLIKFSQLAPTPIEIIESIDMLRVLEHGYNVKMVLIENETYSVDTVSDINKVSKLMENDELLRKYHKRV